MFAADEDLEGRVCAGKSRQGDERVIYTLNLSERWVFQVQRILEKTAVKSEDYFEVRRVVKLAEELRGAVKESQERDLPLGGARAE